MATLQVFKYPISAVDYAVLKLPVGAQLIHVATQRDKPCLWALVDPTAPMEMRKFKVVGTGHAIDESVEKLIHVGSWLMHGDSLVFHLFEIVA